MNFLKVIISVSLSIWYAHSYGQLPFEMLTQQDNSARVDDIYFVSPDLGYACDGGGAIRKITSGGEVIDTVFFDSNLYLRSIEFFNSDTGYCGSLQNKLLRTVDGGESWNEVSLEFDIPGICGMQIFEGGRILASGAWFGPAFYIESTDYGFTWQYRDLSEHASALVDIYFINESVGFTGGKSSNGGVLLKTIDGGDTWNVVLETGLISDIVWKIHQLENTDAVYCAIHSVSGPESIDYAWSNDLGESFELRHSVDYGYTQDVYFFDQSFGMRTGCAGPFVVTNDGGETWIPVAGDICGNKFFKIEDELYLGANAIYKYVEGVLNTEEVGGGQPVYRAILYPNPSEGQVTYEIHTEKADHLKIEVLDLKGRHLLSFPTCHLERGLNNIELDLTSLEQGTYLLQSMVNGGAFSNRVLIR